MTDLTDWTRRMVWYQTKDRVTIPDIVPVRVFLSPCFKPLQRRAVAAISDFQFRLSCSQRHDPWPISRHYWLSSQFDPCLKTKVDWDDEKKKLFSVTETKSGNWQFADSVQDMNSTIKENTVFCSFLPSKEDFLRIKYDTHFVLESTWLYRFILVEILFFSLIRGDGGLLEPGAVKSKMLARPYFQIGGKNCPKL